MIDLREQSENALHLIRVNSHSISKKSDESDLQSEERYEPRI
jgi:hypothetical protein